MSMDLISDLGKAKTRKSTPLIEIYKVCNDLKIMAAQKNYKCCSQSPILSSDVGPPYYLRGFLLNSKKGKKISSQMIVILVEKVILKRTLDFESLKDTFDLTNRELEVLKLLCTGLTNKELSVQLSICENTVKDYMKKLMKKIGASSRTSLITSLQ
jgi:DNA-binding CsgD family transcriptional regulator